MISSAQNSTGLEKLLDRMEEIIAPPAEAEPVTE